MSWEFIIYVVVALIGLPFIAFMVGKAFGQGMERGRIKTFKKYFGDKEVIDNGKKEKQS